MCSELKFSFFSIAFPKKLQTQTVRFMSSCHCCSYFMAPSRRLCLRLLSSGHQPALVCGIVEFCFWLNRLHQSLMIVCSDSMNSIIHKNEKDRAPLSNGVLLFGLAIVVFSWSGSPETRALRATPFHHASGRQINSDQLCRISSIIGSMIHQSVYRINSSFLMAEIHAF